MPIDHSYYLSARGLYNPLETLVRTTEPPTSAKTTHTQTPTLSYKTFPKPPSFWHQKHQPSHPMKISSNRCCNRSFILSIGKRLCHTSLETLVVWTTKPPTSKTPKPRTPVPAYKNIPNKYPFLTTILYLCHKKYPQQPKQTNSHRDKTKSLMTNKTKPLWWTEYQKPLWWTNYFSPNSPTTRFNFASSRSILFRSASTLSDGFIFESTCCRSITADLVRKIKSSHSICQ